MSEYYEGEVIVIIEAAKQGQGYFSVTGFKLDKGMDIQELGEITLIQIPEPVSRNGISCWSRIDIEEIIGYSLYKGGDRLNQSIITEPEYVVSSDVMLQPVIIGGFEPVYGSQGASNQEIPFSHNLAIYPNPYVKQTMVSYSLPRPASAEIKVYNVAGGLVKTLVNGSFDPGYYQVTWHGDDNLSRRVAAGVYFVRISTENYQRQQKVIKVH